MAFRPSHQSTLETISIEYMHHLGRLAQQLNGLLVNRVRCLGRGLYGPTNAILDVLWIGTGGLAVDTLSRSALPNE
jgi:hypothetical protein